MQNKQTTKQTLNSPATLAKKINGLSGSQFVTSQWWRTHTHTPSTNASYNQRYHFPAAVIFQSKVALCRSASSARCSRSSPESCSSGERMAEGENGISSLLIMDHNQPQDYRENRVLIEAQLYVNCFFSSPPPRSQQSFLDMRSNNQKLLWNSNADPQRQAVQYVSGFPQ